MLDIGGVAEEEQYVVEMGQQPLLLSLVSVASVKSGAGPHKSAIPLRRHQTAVHSAWQRVASVLPQRLQAAGGHPAA